MGPRLGAFCVGPRMAAAEGGRRGGGGVWLSKKWLAPLSRGFHSSLAPTARPGSYARKPLLRKAFCGFAVHAAKSDYSLRGLRPPNPQGFFDRLKRERRQSLRLPLFQDASTVRKGRCASPPRRHPSAPLLTGLPPRSFRHWRRSAPAPPPPGFSPTPKRQRKSQAPRLPGPGT